MKQASIIFILRSFHFVVPMVLRILYCKSYSICVDPCDSGHYLPNSNENMVWKVFLSNDMFPPVTLAQDIQTTPAHIFLGLPQANLRAKQLDCLRLSDFEKYRRFANRWLERKNEKQRQQQKQQQHEGRHPQLQPHSHFGGEGQGPHSENTTQGARHEPELTPLHNGNFQGVHGSNRGNSSMSPAMAITEHGTQEFARAQGMHVSAAPVVTRAPAI